VCVFETRNEIAVVSESEAPHQIFVQIFSLKTFFFNLMKQNLILEKESLDFKYYLFLKDI